MLLSQALLKEFIIRAIGILMNEENAQCEEDRIAGILKTLNYVLFGLAFCRLLVLDILMLINDLLTALIIYCTYSTRSRFMSVFCIINGVMGTLYGIILFSKVSTQLSQNSSANYSLLAENSDGGNGSGNQQFQMQDSSNSSTYILALIILGLGTIVYIVITVYSFKAYKAFTLPFGRPLDVLDEENEFLGRNTNPVQNRNPRNQNGFQNSYRQNNQANSNTFRAFHGRGSAVGD